MRLVPTASQRRDCPQAAALIDGLEGVGHVITDAACHPGAPREKIENQLAAETHFQGAPPVRTVVHSDAV